MKTLFKTLVLGTVLTAVGAVSAFAQDGTELENLFNQYKEQKKAACGQRGTALETAKKIIAFSTSTDPKIQEIATLNKEVIDYVKKDSDKIAKEDPVCVRNNAYNEAYKAKDWAKFTSVSKEIIAAEGNSPLATDVMLTLVSVGYDRAAVDKVDTYNADTINYAKQAIQRLESGATSQTGNYGVFLPFKTKEFPDGKTNALNWMNYIVGWINYNRLGATDPGKKKEGLVYLYKSTLVNGENKKDHTIYTNIGDYYFDQAASLDEEYRKIRAANNNTETDEAKAKIALARGYADRSIDAFGRARQIAKQNNKPQIADAITKRLGELYRFRFNIAATAPTPDLEKYVSDLVAKPMPDPSTDVTPVVETAPTTATTTSSTTTTTPSPNAATTGATKAATTTTPVSNTTTPAKKPATPVTKKKGTR
ncbi:MAG TPA: hypothetical protein VIL74_25180 [Pyrinomonadaceae bacterium]|jgi:hypothetical protein